MKTFLLTLVGLVVVAAIVMVVKTNTISRVDLSNNATNMGTTPITTTENEVPTPIPGAAVRPHKDDLIAVDSVTANMVVESPLTVTGEARGSWYFEASFPVRLLDAHGTVLATTTAQAQGDWMTTDYVPFTATLTFATPSTATGTLVLQKDNPSGLPENENALVIPVRFVASGEAQNY